MKRFFGAILALLLAGPVFGQAISHLPSGTTPTGTEFIPIVQGGVTVKVTPAQILSYIDTQTIAWTNPQTYSQLMTLNGGLTVATGNVGITTGNLSVGGTSTLTTGATISYPSSGPAVTINSKGDSYSDIGFSVTALSPHAAIGAFTDGETGNKIWGIGSGLGGVGAFGIYDITDNLQAFIATSSVVNFPNGTFEVAGHPVELYGTIVATGSSCSISSSYASQGFSSCVRNSTGNYTVYTTVTAPSPYVCTGIGNGFPYFVYEGAGTTASFVSIGLANSGGAPADGTFELICKG